MTGVIGRRLLLLIPVMLLVSMALFALSLQIDPGRAARVRAGGIDATVGEVEAIRAELRLDDHVVVRYARWLGDAVRLDLGRSYVRTEFVRNEAGETVMQGRSVRQEIATALPRTLSIASVGLVFGVVVGSLVGLVGGLRPGSLWDRLSMLFSTLGIAMPSYWLIMLFTVFFSINRDWLPATGYLPLSAGFWPWLSHVLLPGVAVGLAVAAITARQLRASVMDVMGESYIRTAWAKGSTSYRVVVRHALRNALSAPLTTFGNMFAHMIGGTVVIETLVGIQGVGLLTVSAVRANDIIMLQGIVLFFVVVTIVINLIVDVLYVFANPKIRLS